MFEKKLPLALAGLAASGIIYLTFLAFQSITNRLRAKGENIKPEEVGFILKQEMEAGKTKVISGFFNRNTNEVTQQEVTVADEIDYENYKEEQTLQLIINLIQSNKIDEIIVDEKDIEINI